MQNYKSIYDVLRETIEDETKKGCKIYSASFEIKFYKDISSDGINDIKTISLNIGNINKAF